MRHTGPGPREHHLAERFLLLLSTPSDRAAGSRTGATTTTSPGCAAVHFPSGAAGLPLEIKQLVSRCMRI